MIKGKEQEFFVAHPTTAERVIEVAVSSPAHDRENVSLFAEAGVKEYWIVLGGPSGWRRSIRDRKKGVIRRSGW